MNSLLIAENIIKRTLKSVKELILMIALPIAAIGIMTIMTGDQGTQKVAANIVNLDSGIYGKTLSSHIESQQNIKVVNLNKDNYIDNIKNGKSNLAVIIPESFSKDIENGKKTHIEFYAANISEVTERLKQDINQYITGLYMIAWASGDISEKTDNDKAKIADALFTRINEETISSNLKLAGTNDDGQKGRLISSIGFSIMFLMVFVFNTMGTIMEDKKKLTLARMFTFKVKEWEIIFGNLLGSLTLGTIQLVPVTGVLVLVYKIKNPMEIIGLFLILFCFLITTIGFGIGISGLIKNDYNPSLIIAAVIFPTSLLGGCLIPESMLPPFLTRIGFAVPQKWVISAIQKLITGSGIQGIMLDLGIILMFGLALSTFGVKMLKPLND